MGIGFGSRFSPDSPVSRTPVTTATPCFSRDRTSLGSRLSTPASGLGRTRRRPGPRLARRLRCRRWTAACRRAGCKTRTPRCRPRPASPAWHSSPAGPGASCSRSGTCCFSDAGAGNAPRERGEWRRAPPRRGPGKDPWQHGNSSASQLTLRGDSPFAGKNAAAGFAPCALGEGGGRGRLPTLQRQPGQPGTPLPPATPPSAC